MREFLEFIGCRVQEEVLDTSRDHDAYQKYLNKKPKNDGIIDVILNYEQGETSKTTHYYDRQFNKLQIYLYGSLDSKMKSPQEKHPSSLYTMLATLTYLICHIWFDDQATKEEILRIYKRYVYPGLFYVIQEAKSLRLVKTLMSENEISEKMPVFNDKYLITMIKRLRQFSNEMQNNNNPYDVFAYINAEGFIREIVCCHMNPDYIDDIIKEIGGIRSIKYLRNKLQSCMINFPGSQGEIRELWAIISKGETSQQDYLLTRYKSARDLAINGKHKSAQNILDEIMLKKVEESTLSDLYTIYMAKLLSLEISLNTGREYSVRQYVFMTCDSIQQILNGGIISSRLVDVRDDDYEDYQEFITCHRKGKVAWVMLKSVEPYAMYIASNEEVLNWVKKRLNELDC